MVTMDGTDSAEHQITQEGLDLNALELLERIDLSENDVHAFVNNESLTPVPVDNELEEYKAHRRDLARLSKDVPRGMARIDSLGRLVPINPQPPPPTPPRPHQQQVPLQRQPPPPQDEYEYHRQWLEQEEFQASEAISRAVARYRKRGIPDSDLELIRVSAPGRRPRSPFWMSVQRWLLFCLAILTGSFVMLAPKYDIFGLRNSSPVPFRAVDRHLMSNLLNLKLLLNHEDQCPGLNRTDSGVSSPWNRFYYWRQAPINCADSVLHVPAKHLVTKVFSETRGRHDKEMLFPYIESGFQKQWWLPCRSPFGPYEAEYMRACRAIPTCPVENTETKDCFRGIHDDVATQWDVRAINSFGARLIQEGGDHFDVHYDTSLLYEDSGLFQTNRVTRIVEKIQKILLQDYQVDVEPAAFRVYAAGSFNGAETEVPTQKRKSLMGMVWETLEGDQGLHRLVNWTNYKRYMIEAYHKNDRPSLWSNPDQHERDACQLLSDMQVDPRWLVHTSLFLSTGAGEDFTGGATLYMDDHDDNRNVRQKIQRGVTVDASRGRLVVSSGGLENQRCKLPVRSGIRAALQIWWSCKNMSASQLSSPSDGMYASRHRRQDI